MAETDMAEAWALVEAVQRRHPGWRFSLLGGHTSLVTVWNGRSVEVLEDRRNAFGWYAEFFGHEDPRQCYGDRHASEWAPTAAAAIRLACEAAERAATTEEGGERGE